MLEKLQGLQAGLDLRKRTIELRNDFTVLKNIWFKKLADTDDHAERLEQFYGPQAHACKCDACPRHWASAPPSNRPTSFLKIENAVLLPHFLEGITINRHLEPLMSQMIASDPSFCGVASPSLLLALPG